MTAPIDKARGEGNCVEATRRGEEAGASAARLRTETFYKAGRIRRVSQASRSRSQTIRLVKSELVRRQITFLSGEICPGGLRAVVAPGSRACPKAWNAVAKVVAGGAEVSSGRSTELASPRRTGRTKRGRTRKSHRSARSEGAPLRRERPPARCPDRDEPPRRRARNQP